MRIKPVRVIPVVVAFAIFLSACGEVVEKGLKPSEDWSRGIPVADSVNGEMGFHAAGSGDALYLSWPEHTIERTNIHFLQLNRQGSEVAHQRLEILTGRQRMPRVAPAAEDRFHLFWLRRPPRENYWELWYALLDPGGNILDGPAVLSSGDMDAGSYDYVSQPDGSIYLVCDCGAGGGLFGLRVGPGGERGVMERLTLAGNTPSLRRDRAGDLHMAWFEGTQIKYAQFLETDSKNIEEVIITTLPIGTGDSFLGPSVGLSDGWVYILWSTLSRSGLEAGTARTEYIVFQAGNPDSKTRAERIFILPVEEQPYEPFTGAVTLSRLVGLGSVGLNSEYIYEPRTAVGEKPELAVALVTNQNYRQDILVQPVIVLFEGGRLIGYSIAGKTLSFSRDPAIVLDTEANLHMAWREGAGGDQIFYATTAPETKAAIDQFGSEDLVSMLLRGGLEGFATALLFPIALPWLVPGFVIVGVWKLLRDRESLEMYASRVILVVAVIAYQFSKLLFVPTILSYVPFSAWIDIPAGWSVILRVLVPLLIICTGLIVAELGRRRNSSTILYYALFSISDLVLTMGVYGVNFLGVF